MKTKLTTIFFTISLYFAIASTGTWSYSKYRNVRDTLTASADSAILKEIRSRMSESKACDTFLVTFDIDTLINELHRRKERRSNRGISGQDDDRLDLYNLKRYSPAEDSIFSTLRHSVAAIIPKRFLSRDRNGKYSFQNLRPFWQAYGFCDPKVHFGLQPTCAIATAFYVGTRKLLTAGHAFKGANPRDFFIVFGYEMSDEHNYKRVFTKYQVLEIDTVQELISRTNNTDIALISLQNSPPKYVRPLRMRLAPPRYNESFSIIGFPHGLPSKYAGGMKLLNKSESNTFRIKGDIFEGNSGAPVFDKHGSVMGMVVRGGIDTQVLKVNGCPYLYNCDLMAGASCMGETIQNSTALTNSMLNFK